MFVMLFHCFSQDTDRALHRLGGVRVSKAGILNFSTWLESLSNTVSKWNQSGKKGCKCGPDNADENEVPEIYSTVVVVYNRSNFFKSLFIFVFNRVV